MDHGPWKSMWTKMMKDEEVRSCNILLQFLYLKKRSHHPFSTCVYAEPALYNLS